MELKRPWSLIYPDSTDEFVVYIKENLPATYELQPYKLYARLKLEGNPVLIVDDDVNGNCLLNDPINRKRLGGSNLILPSTRIFQSVLRCNN